MLTVATKIFLSCAISRRMCIVQNRGGVPRAEGSLQGLLRSWAEGEITATKSSLTWRRIIAFEMSAAFECLIVMLCLKSLGDLSNFSASADERLNHHVVLHGRIISGPGNGNVCAGCLFNRAHLSLITACTVAIVLSLSC